MSKTYLVTGGAGFIGSAVILQLLKRPDTIVANVDKLTYCGNPASLASVAKSPRYRFFHADVADAEAMNSIIEEVKPDAIMHLAAESHVDRSIDGPGIFIKTNIVGTFTLLEAAKKYWSQLPDDKKTAFRFHHISTDEVFGDLGTSGGYFHEDTPYQPSSPYSASKASSDHLVRAWHRTYGLPVIVTNCSNNYGPRQFPEKLIPLCILRALAGQSIPVYGKGEQIRDWLYVEDHARALEMAVDFGKPGATYNVGGSSERRNIDVVKGICQVLDGLVPEKLGEKKSFAELITHVTDRPGHDTRYAIDASLIQKELGWKPSHTFEEGLAETVRWYLDNKDWWQPILDGTYKMDRLGKIAD